MANSFTAAGVPTTMTLSGIATIENGDQTSAAIPNSGRAVVRLGFPTITSTTMTLLGQAFPATGTTAAASFRPIVDKDGIAISYTIGSDKLVTVPDLSGIAAFKIVMGSNEASTRSIEVTSRGDNPVVSPTEIDVDIESGATITANQGTKTATATNGWLVTPTTAAGVEYATANTGDAQSPAGMQNVIPMMETGAGTVGPQTAASLAGVYAQTQAVLPYNSNGGTPAAQQGAATAAATGVGTMATHRAPTSAAAVTATQAVSTALDDNLQVKASAGNLYGFTAYSKTAQFIQIHNVASAPGGGAVPFAGQSYPVAANGVLTVDFDPPLRCGTGIFIGNSSTGDTYTDGGDDVLFGVQYV